MRRLGRQICINVALQGGGAHGAFTWGVLDRLLEDPHIDIGWISGTSAGAVNAVAVASGLATGGREGARECLRQVWHGVHKAGVTDLIRMNPFLYGLTRSPAMAQVTGLMSPYDFNPLGFDPLRRLLSESIDFNAIRSGRVELLIAATEVASGRARLFRRHEMSVDAVLASACLPTLHHTVVIDGVGYWDGGFSANPDIVNLAMQSPVRDTLIVQLNPLVKIDLPTGVREIAGEVNRLTFGAPLLRDVQLLETVRTTSRGWLGWRGPWAPLARHRFHLVEAGRYTAGLRADTKMKPDWGLFTYLHGAGRTEMHKWLDRHRDAVGRRGSVDLVARYLKPAETPPARAALSVGAGDEAPPPANGGAANDRRAT